MLILYWLTLFNLFAETIPTVVISDDKPQPELTRSITWPVQTEVLTPAAQLPSFDEAINSINGLQSRSQGSPTFSVRGSEQSGRALILYDEIPLNFASGFGAPPLLLPKENLHHIEVVKGPASLFYGSQAMAGAINFVSKKYTRPEITLRASDTNESFLPWRRGALGHRSYQLAMPLYQSPQSHWQSTVFYEDSDGEFPYQNQSYSGVRTHNDSTLARATLRGSQQWDRVKLDFNSIVGRQTLQSPGPVNYRVLTRSETEGALLSLAPQFFIGDQHTLKSRVSYLLSEAEFLESGAVTHTNQTTTIVQNEWITDWSSKTKLQFFADGFLHRLDNSFVGDRLKQDNFEAGPFFTFHSSETWQHQIGGRYLFRNQVFLPTLATHWLPGDFDFWVSASQGFRNPTLADLYSNSPIFLGNANLQAEKSTQYELGAKSTKKLGWLWDARIFHMEYDNFIETYQISPGVSSRENQGSGFSRGLDLETRWQLTKTSFGLSYNFLETRNRRQSRAFRLSPKHQLTVEASHRWRDIELMVQNTHWYDFIDTDFGQTVKMQDWQQWNFFLTLYTFKDLEIQAGLINAFNEGKQLAVHYPEPQRKYWLQIKKMF